MAKRKKKVVDESRTYKLITVVGTSKRSYDDAVKSAVKTASKTLSGLGWFEVKELRGAIADGEVAEFQATVAIGFRLLNE